jgi:DNA-binding NarL/FixJ family response regulator
VLFTVQTRDRRAARARAASRTATPCCLDLALPGTRGLAFLVELRRERPRPARSSCCPRRTTRRRSTAPSPRRARLRVEARRRGEVVDAVKTRLRGGPAGGERVGPAVAPGPSWPTGLPIGFTQRQSDVLRLLVQGKPNKLICRDLALSEGTVKVHVSAILKALNVHTRTQAIVELARRGVDVDALRP